MTYNRVQPDMGLDDVCTLRNLVTFSLFSSHLVSVGQA